MTCTDESCIIAWLSSVYLAWFPRSVNVSDAPSGKMIVLPTWSYGPHEMLRFVTLACVLHATVAAPVVPRDSPGPPGASGSLTGTEALLGPDGNPVDASDSAIVSDYQLVPGQTEESDYGLYLDFTDTPNPQPIRGTYGATDAGPSMILVRQAIVLAHCGFI